MQWSESSLAYILYKNTCVELKKQKLPFGS